MERIIKLLLCVAFCLGVTKLYAQRDFDRMSWSKVALRMPAEWYASDQAAAIAETVMAYQTEIGGWPKNIGFHRLKWKKGDKVEDNGSTFDNDATTTEMRFLAKMYESRKDEKYKSAFMKAFNYILKAQYANGGWPQFYPPREDNGMMYSDCITFNDNAYVNVMDLLKDIFNDAPCFKALSLNDEVKAKARQAFDRGVQCILDMQIRVNGERTVWCAQHHQETLAPAKARSYELESFSGGESVGVVFLLMSLPNPSEDVVAAVKGAVKWFEGHKIEGIKIERFKNEDGDPDARVVPSAGSVIWARFYDLDTEKPFFCDRDGIKKNTLQEIGRERRGGYGWYTTAPAQLLEAYPEWAEKNGVAL